MIRHFSNKQGSILVFALWTIVLLSLLASQIGLTLRQRINLLSHVERRSQLRHIAEAGVKKALAAIIHDLERTGNIYVPYSKFYRHDNPELFQHTELGQGYFSINYSHYDTALAKKDLKYGMVDEESKINVNIVDSQTIKKLVFLLFTPNEKLAQDLTDSIIDWRQFGQSQLTGFYSEFYYSNLKYPYTPKKGPFETMDELLLLQYFSEDILERLKPFMTIYGDGKININTASREVLLAVGLEPLLIDKIFLVRRGLDSVDFTVDDFIFQKPYDIASDIRKFIELESHEAKQIDQLNAYGKLKTNSQVFLIQSEGKLTNREDALTISCVYNAKDKIIEYWREK